MAIQFFSQDPAGLASGMNPYAFVGNNPIDGRDPGGLKMLWDPMVLDGLCLGSCGDDDFQDSDGNGMDDCAEFTEYSWGICWK